MENSSFCFAGHKAKLAILDGNGYPKLRAIFYFDILITDPDHRYRYLPVEQNISTCLLSTGYMHATCS